MGKFELEDLDRLTDDELSEGIVVPFDNTAQDFSLFLHKDRGGARAFVLDTAQKCMSQINSPELSFYRCGLQDKLKDFGIVGVCGDGVIPTFPEVPHRDLKVLPELRGEGMATLLMDVLDRIDGVLEREIGFKIDRQRLLVGRGYMPIRVHFFPEHEDVKTKESYVLNPKESKKIVSFIEAMYRRNWVPERTPFALEFVHTTTEIYRGKFNQSPGLSDEVGTDLGSLIIQWDEFLSEESIGMDKDEASRQIRDFIDRFNSVILDERDFLID